MFQHIPICKSSKNEKFPHQKESEECDVHFFQLNSETEELKSLKYHFDDLQENEIYILINDTIKRIFLWIGSRVSVRSRFIGAHSASLIQRKKGIDYRVVSVVPKHEPPEFHNTLSVLVDR
ncbi:MAG: hypothetical protein ACFFB2_08930 [Promethearchaeota archaeon]